MTTPNYITKNGLELLRRELDHLQRTLRPQVAEEVRVAAAQGDRSENAAYRFGKQKLRTIDSRLRFLIGRLDHVIEVDPSDHEGTTVKFGATVVVEDQDEVVKTWRIYGEDEIDLEKGIISWRSPLAQALLGKQEGDGVTFHVPAGERELDILEVRYDPQELLPADLIPLKLRYRA